MAFIATGFAAALGAAGTVSTVASVLSGVATVGATLMSLGQAQQARSAADVQSQFELAAGRAAFADSLIDADLATLEGERSALASEENAIRLRREMIQKIGDARVAFAGSGIDIRSGQLANIEAGIIDDADFETGIERRNAEIARTEAAIKASRTVASGNNSVFASEARSFSSLTSGRARATSSYAQAFGTAATGLTSLARRG